MGKDVKENSEEDDDITADDEDDEDEQIFGNSTLSNYGFRNFTNFTIEDVDQYDMEEYLDLISSSTDAYSSCKCLPSCSSIHYDVEISQTNLNLDKYKQKKSVNNNDNSNDEYECFNL